MISEEQLIRAKRRSHIFKALAHPMRVYLLEKIKEKTWCVCELAKEAGIPKSAASKHLSQLKEAGLVEDQKRGTRVEYRLTAPCIIELITCTEDVVLKNRKKRLGI